MPGCESVLDAKGNEQLKRRFSNREQIEPFSWKAEKEGQEFRQLLRSIEDELPLLEHSNLADLATAFLIYQATDGVINYVMKLLRRAARMAIERRANRIDHPVLADAYEQVLAKEFKQRPNPFLTLLNESQAKRSANRAAPAIGATSKRVKARKRKANVSDVLTTR
jgi:hypothetical protein